MHLGWSVSSVLAILLAIVIVKDYIETRPQPLHTVSAAILPIDVEEFVSTDVCDWFIDYTERSIDAALSISVGNSYWNSRVIYPSDMHEEPLKALKELVYRVMETVGRHYGLDKRSLYVDTVVLARMREGDSVDWHADNAYFPNCAPNYAAHRTYSAVIYLNGHDSDLARRFTGGIFQFYTRQHQPIVPRAGRMIAFGAGCDYFHRATPVESGSRYTIAMWFTDRSDKANAHFHQPSPPPPPPMSPVFPKAHRS
jgi:hypothetical protein